MPSFLIKFNNNNKDTLENPLALQVAEQDVSNDAHAQHAEQLERDQQQQHAAHCHRRRSESETQSAHQRKTMYVYVMIVQLSSAIFVSPNCAHSNVYSINSSCVP